MRALAAGIITFIYIFFCLGCWWWHSRKTLRLQIESCNTGEPALLIGFASQTGKAATLALQTANQLQQAGMGVQLIPLNKIQPSDLTNCNQALFIASTYGEGEAPDNGNRFLKTCIAHLPVNSLSHLKIGILALGDSRYQYYCGFGHQLHKQLHNCGATSLFDLIEVDQDDPGALRHWQYYLGALSGSTVFNDWDKPEYQQWQLVERNQLNYGSPGAPVFSICLNNQSENHWQAGDIAEIGPCNSQTVIQEFLNSLERATIIPERLATKNLLKPGATLSTLQQLNDEQLLAALPELPHREYSIASIPQEDKVQLLVRQHFADNQLGLGSGWLTQHAPLNSSVRLRIRSNPHFHAPAASVPMILIGNGTGIAGLRAHIAARALLPGTQNWLFFGERTAAHDYFFAEDIQHWQENGVLTQVNTIFSRDEISPGYVQHLLQQHSCEINRWARQGAAFYVCGSLKGMAHGVDAALQEILGHAVLESLANENRYCRDVY